MSSVTRPRGPRPAGVYWVRRLLVLGVAALLVLVIGKVLGGGSDGSSGPQAETVAGEPSSSAPTSYGPTVPVAPTTPSPGRKKRGGSTPQASPSATLPAATGPCADDDVIVTPVTGEPPAGGDVVIRLDLTTRTSLACTVTVSPDTVALRISRQNGRFVWSTQACPAAMPTTTVTARRDVPGSVTVTWSGHYANSTCTDAGAWATAGWYHAVATVLGGAETDVQWQLGDAVPATVTRTASPSGTPTRALASPGSSPTTRPTGTRSGASEPNR